jgi:transposase
MKELGHEVIVAQASKVRLIGESRKKDDRLDARTLARLARVDPELLGPIQHRSARAQADLIMIRARAGLVRARTALINAFSASIFRGLQPRNRGTSPAAISVRRAECGECGQHHRRFDSSTTHQKRQIVWKLWLRTTWMQIDNVAQVQ